MIYSRWGNGSVWYCFWNKYKAEMKFKLPTTILKRKQTFQIYDVPSYYITYGYIQDNGISKVLDDIKSFYNDHRKRPSEKNMMLMMAYIGNFQNSVDSEFKITTFLYNNWIEPIKNSKYGRIFKRVV
jgi:hypothetical protein